MAEEEKKINTIEGLDRESNGEDSSGGEERTEGGELSDAVVLHQEVAAKAEEVKALNDKYLRQAAEFENYKRLAQRDQREQIKFGNEHLLRELLPTVDNLDRALKAAKNGSGGDALVQGVDLTLKQLLGTLGKFGVQPVPTVGQRFDPASHQAVASVPSDDIPAHHVVEEFQRGYLLHDRILRPAMVTVSAGPASEETSA